jgi:aryl-alcohol dehydrogenase-like predicted oxidoreductase
MSLIPSGKPPTTPLGIHRILSPRSGLRVSPLCFGAMNLGNTYSSRGAITKDEGFQLLDAYYESGGNFIDTANNYQGEQSEEWLGEWISNRGIRDQLVIATKYTTNHKQYDTKTEHGIGSNYGGNHTKSLHLSLLDSLRKLRTDYLDILYVHWWDYTTSIEEVMHSLDIVVKSGKVFYLGISDTPAWIVSKANQYARDHALTPFVIYQGLWNVMVRDFERDIIPMCIDEGLAIVPWGAAGQGRFKSKAEINEHEEAVGSVNGKGQSDTEKKISTALEKVGKEVGASITAVAIAYCLQRCPYVFPVIGGYKVEHLLDNIKALEITLSEEQIGYLEEQTPFDLCFPYNVFGSDPRRGETQFSMQKIYPNLAWVKHASAIRGRPVSEK